MTKDDPKATSGETSPAAAEKIENEKEAASTTSTPTSSTTHKASTPRTREALRVFKLKGGLCEVEGCEQKSLEDAAASNKDGDNEEDEGKKHLCQNHLDNGEDTPSEPVKRGRKRKSDKDDDDDDDDDDDNEDPKKNKPSGEEAAVETTDMDTEEKDSPPATPGTTSTDVCTPATTPGSVTRSGFKSCEIIGCEKLRARGGYCLRYVVTKHNGCAMFNRVHFLLYFMSIFARYSIHFLIVSSCLIQSNLINVATSRTKLLRYVLVLLTMNEEFVTSRVVNVYVPRENIAIVTTMMRLLLFGTNPMDPLIGMCHHSISERQSMMISVFVHLLFAHLLYLSFC